MSSDLGQFLEACGANGPLRLEWDDWETGRINLEMKATGAGLARPDPGPAPRRRQSGTPWRTAIPSRGQGPRTRASWTLRPFPAWWGSVSSPGSGRGEAAGRG